MICSHNQSLKVSNVYAMVHRYKEQSVSVHTLLSWLVLHPDQGFPSQRGGDGETRADSRQIQATTPSVVASILNSDTTPCAFFLGTHFFLRTTNNHIIAYKPNMLAIKMHLFNILTYYHRLTFKMSVTSLFFFCFSVLSLLDTPVRLSPFNHWEVSAWF